MQRPLRVPELHSHAPPVSINPHLILRAIVVREARGLDMALWNRAIQAREDDARRSASDAEPPESQPLQDSVTQ